jgi:hypothetical protein
MATINNKQREKKRKQRIEMEREEEDCAPKKREEEDCAPKEREVEDCAQNQKSEQNEGSGCKVAKTEHGVCNLVEITKVVVHGPDHCIHCDEEPCVFIRMESRLCENDEVYFQEEDYAKDHVAYNSWRRKQAYKYANELTSMRRSSYGKASAFKSLTTSALSVEFRCFFLP